MSDSKAHEFQATIRWTGAGEAGTRDYKSYDRSYDVVIEGKPVVAGTAAPEYRGDPTRHNPEDMLVASSSSCHMLWYLHLCAVNNIVVMAYEDRAVGTLEVEKDGSGRFSEIMLRPKVTISAESDLELAESLHAEARVRCFIARTLNCPVTHDAVVERA